MSKNVLQFCPKSACKKQVTAYIGGFLNSNFDLPDRRNDDEYSEWFEDYEKYKTYYDSFAVYSTYNPQTGISFVTDGYNAKDFFVNGINDCETSWSWSKGSQSDAFFRYDNTKTNDLTLSLEYNALYTYELAYQEVVVYLNDVILGTQQLFETSGTVSISIPEGLMKANDINHLCIKYPQIENTDDNALAVAYSHMYVK
jgi:hypothetical protein